MTGPAYPAARAVAGSAEEHFVRQIEIAREQGVTDLPPRPTAEAIEAIIDAAFWASLRREEGHSPKISLALVPPEGTREPLLFERTLPLAPDALARLAPAVERPGIHLGVWFYGEELRVWGATHSIPCFCFVLEVVEPGLLVIKHRRGEEVGKFVNVAVLQGDRIRVVDEDAASLPDCPELLAALVDFDAVDSWRGTVSVLVQLAVSMRAHRRGGSLLIVPAGSDAWRRSIVQPVSYEVNPPYSELAVLLRRHGERVSRESLLRAVDALAGLTAVDGATILNDRFELLAFGAKIERLRGSPPIERLVLTEPIVGDTPEEIHPAKLGGTRHLSAAQFVQDQPDTLALVASQDGRFTVFAWSPCENAVHGHRVETLLL